MGAIFGSETRPSNDVPPQYIWKPVPAGDNIVDIWEARHCGRPIAWICTHLEAGRMPEASLCEQGKPDNAGGPVINAL